MNSWKILGWVFLYLWPAALPTGPRWLTDAWMITLTIMIIWWRKVQNAPVRPRIDLRRAANQSRQYPPTPEDTP